MGWTYSHRNNEKVADLLAADLKPHEIVACAVKLRTAYLAVQWHDGDKIGAVVALLNYVRNDYYNFGVKYVSEDMGPHETACPGHILDLLTPVDQYTHERSQEWAQTWRDTCRANLQRNAARPRLAVGMAVKFPEPIRFRSGDVFDTLIVEKVKPLTFSAGGWKTYKVPRRLLNDAQIVQL